MSAYQEFTGKSVEEALRHARDEFGVGLDELDFEILTLSLIHISFRRRLYSPANR